MQKLVEKKIIIKNKEYQFLDTEIGEKAIIFVHGLGSSKDIMPKIFNSFLSDYRCIFLDLPAHNKIPSYEFKKLSDFGNYIINFIEGTHLKNFSLVGFSFGGLVSIQTQKMLKEKGLDIKAVAWGSPLRIDFLTIKSHIFFRIVDRINKKSYKKLPESNLFRFFVALIGIKVANDELDSFKYFENNMLDKFYKLIPTKFINTYGQKILYIFGTRDPLIKESAYKKTYIYQKYQTKYLIKKGAHYMKREGKMEAHKLIKKFIDLD